MKLVIYLVAGLVLGLGGGTAYKALEVKGEVEARYQAVADSVRQAQADSLAAVAAAREAGEAGEEYAAGGDGHRETGAGHEAPEGSTMPAGDPAEVPVDVALSRDAGEPVPGAEPDSGSTGGENPGRDVASGDTAVADSLGGTPDSEAGADGADGAPGLGDDATGAAGSVVTDEGARRLARVFGAMRAADAARVLAELSDPEVEAILIKLGDRQAGQILSTFPADRAAELSRRVLGRNGGDR